MATVFEVRDEIREVVEPMIPPVKVPERQAGGRSSAGCALTRHPGEPSRGGACIWRVPCHWHWLRYAHCRQGRPP